MNYGTVSGLTMGMMGAACLCGFAIPLLLFWYFRKKKGADVRPFLIGCGVMLVFAFGLEGLVHRLVLGSSAGQQMQSKPWLLALYGGLMAGLFEETGRLVAFTTVLKRFRSKDIDALMYGAGHGGLEAAAILGLGMLNQLIFSVMLNQGAMAEVIGALPGPQAAQVQQLALTLTTAPAYLFLLGIVERCFAVVLHLSFSVMVWFAVKQKNCRYLFLLAIALHALVDTVTVALSKNGIGSLSLEVAIGVLTLAVGFYAHWVWQRCTGRVQRTV